MHRAAQGQNYSQISPHDILQNRTLSARLASHHYYLWQVDRVVDVDRDEHILQLVHQSKTRGQLSGSFKNEEGHDNEAIQVGCARQRDLLDQSRIRNASRRCQRRHCAWCGLQIVEMVVVDAQGWFCCSCDGGFRPLCCCSRWPLLFCWRSSVCQQVDESLALCGRSLRALRWSGSCCKREMKKQVDRFNVDLDRAAPRNANIHKRNTTLTYRLGWGSMSDA